MSMRKCAMFYDDSGVMPEFQWPVSDWRIGIFRRCKFDADCRWWRASNPIFTGHRADTEQGAGEIVDAEFQRREVEPLCAADQGFGVRLRATLAVISISAGAFRG